MTKMQVCVWEVLENIQYSTYWNWGRKYNLVCVCVCVCVFVCQYVTLQPTFRYKERCVEEVRESSDVVAFSFPFLVAFLADDESCEGAIHSVVGHLARRNETGCQMSDMMTGTNLRCFHTDVFFLPVLSLHVVTVSQ